MHINEVEFTIFDTETTGLKFIDGERVVEIAALRFKNQTIKAHFDSLINQPRPVSAGAFAVNKITAQMVAAAPPAKDVLSEFLKFSQGSCLGSYNAEFDFGFLNNELRLACLPELKDPRTFDILTMARRLMPGLERYALWFVAEKLGISGSQQHRAFADVELAFDVFHKLKSIFLGKGLTGLEAFLKYSC